MATYGRGVDGNGTGLGGWVRFLAKVGSPISKATLPGSRTGITYPAWSWRVSKFLLSSDMVGC